ncbi:MAG: ankyrin repeat domain-containing protein [Alphaproteobacteria bacterium]
MPIIKYALNSLSFFILLCVFSTSAFAFWGNDAKQIKHDEQRTHDILAIADLIEEYYAIKHHYPLVSEPQKDILSTLISQAPPKKILSHFTPQLLEQELSTVLKRTIPLPRDPKDGDDWRFYQYATDGQNFYVSAFLYNAKPYAKPQGKRHHKIELTSKPCLKCVQYKPRDIKRFLSIGVDKKELQDQLFSALKERDFEAAKVAIKDGGNLSPICDFHHRCQPLASAAEKGDIEMIQFLLDNGADPDGFNGYYDIALIYAMGANQEKAAKVLITSGADVNLPNAFGMTPFIGGIAMGNTEITELMIQHGAYLDRSFLVQNSSAPKGSKNMFPLQAAIKSGSPDMVQILLSHGADKTQRTQSGKTLLELAHDTKNPKIIAFFVK